MKPPPAKSFPSDVTVAPPIRMEAFDPLSPAPDAGPQDVKAIFVTHGMGQQVRFETVETVARALEPWWEPQPGRPDKKVLVREIQVGQQKIQRAEIRLRRHPMSETTTGTTIGTAPEAAPRFVDVHLYEAYWAPLTEGKVGLSDVFSFLARAGWNGITNSRSSFQRWAFDHVVQYPIRGFSTFWKLVVALAVIVSLYVLQTVVVAAFAGTLFFRDRVAWPNGQLLSWLLWIVVGILSAAALAAAPIVLQHRAQGKRPIAKGRLPKPFTWLTWTFVMIAMVALVSGAFAAGGRAIAAAFAESTPAGPDRNWILAAALWAGVSLLGVPIRHFLVQYVGDVAVYLSGSRVSKFNDIRQAIKETSLVAGRAVYGALSRDRAEFAYGKVLVVGHSLGSVIAYDTLNALMRDDAFANLKLHVADRTEMLLTLGSPLNKSAFIFRTQMGKESEIREAMAASVQPMIQSYPRPPWVNLYSPNDWISGALSYYDDDPSNPGQAAGQVGNVADSSATTPLAAHVEYWKGPLFAQTLWAALVS